MSFIGRTKELELLREQVTKKEATMVALLGRRRIGKSTLIKHCATLNKMALFEFQGLAPRPGLTNQDQLKHFARSLAPHLGAKSLEFADWSQALGMLSQLPLSRRTIVLLDEISWLGGKDSNFAGKLKEQWDIKLSQNKNIVLIICGSVSSWIQKNILTGTGFAGRVSLEINLGELSIHESNLLLREKKKNLTASEIAKFLSVTGGVPRYLEEMNVKETAEDNIKLRCFNGSGFLFSEFDKIFSEVFGKRHKLYQKILLALQDGPLQPKKIAESINTPLTGDLTDCISDLSLGGFVKRDHTWSFSGVESRLSRIRTSDNYSRFYLKYIYPRKSRIVKKPLNKNDTLDFLNWTPIFGYQFENLIQNNIDQLIDLLHIPPSDILQLGPFFQTGTKARAGVQIDFLIQCKRNLLHLIEIKSGARITAEVISEVQEKVHRIKVPKGFSIRCHLVHLGELSEAIIEEDFFDQVIAFERFL